MVQPSLLLLCLLSFLSMETCWSFVAVSNPQSKARTTQLQMANSADNKHKMLKGKFAAAVLAAAFMFSDVVGAPPAFAADQDFGSSQIVARGGGGRSGGRMGGRVGRRTAASRVSRPGAVRSGSVATPVIVTPGPFGYTPFSPFGYGFGFGGGIGDTFRDYRQDDELARERAELESTRLKNAELEQRLARLESASKASPQQIIQPQQMVPQ